MKSLCPAEKVDGICPIEKCRVPLTLAKTVCKLLPALHSASALRSIPKPLGPPLLAPSGSSGVAVSDNGLGSPHESASVQMVPSLQVALAQVVAPPLPPGPSLESVMMVPQCEGEEPQAPAGFPPFPASDPGIPTPSPTPTPLASPPPLVPSWCVHSLECEIGSVAILGSLAEDTQSQCVSSAR